MRLLSEIETVPDSRPALAADLFTALDNIDPNGNSLAVYHSWHASHAPSIPLEPIWSRIEDFIGYRWGEREVVWIVEGPGIFETPLVPAVIDTVEVWSTGAWTTATLAAAPFGLQLESQSYRITATVGDTSVPPSDVQEAIRRFAMYAVNLWSETGGWSQRDEVSTVPSWPARALQYSGAADLLRKYRRLGVTQCA